MNEALNEGRGKRSFVTSPPLDLTFQKRAENFFVLQPSNRDLARIEQLQIIRNSPGSSSHSGRSAPPRAIFSNHAATFCGTAEYLLSNISKKYPVDEEAEPGMRRSGSKKLKGQASERLPPFKYDLSVSLPSFASFLAETVRIGRSTPPPNRSFGIVAWPLEAEIMICGYEFLTSPTTVSVQLGFRQSQCSLRTARPSARFGATSGLFRRTVCPPQISWHWSRKACFVRFGQTTRDLAPMIVNKKNKNRTACSDECV